MFCLFLSPGAPCGNVGASAPNGGHDSQLLGDFLDRDILRKPLQSVDHGLFVRHGFDHTASERHGQELESRTVSDWQGGFAYRVHRRPAGS